LQFAFSNEPQAQKLRKGKRAIRRSGFTARSSKTWANQKYFLVISGGAKSVPKQNGALVGCS
jgi:hypothetical protein